MKRGREEESEGKSGHGPGAESRLEGVEEGHFHRKKVQLLDPHPEPAREGDRVEGQRDGWEEEQEREDGERGRKGRREEEGERVGVWEVGERKRERGKFQADG
eukprot:1978470-Rhodomonas_salina.1